MKSNLALFVATACLSGMSIATPAQAGKASGWANGSAFAQGSSHSVVPGPVNQNGRMSLLQVANTLVPLSQVLETINTQEPGTQLDTNTVMENGKAIYVVRWQASRGRIIIFRVDAETGQIVGRQG